MNKAVPLQPGPVIFMVATPIGHLEDISLRAVRILADVDLIAAEDTRNTRKLLNHLGIKGKELVSYHDHNESGRAKALIDRLITSQGRLAVVSDAGTPCIADPGFRLVQAAHAALIPVIPIPGPSSLTALVSASGLPSNRLLFVGFLPTKAKALQAEMSRWREVKATVVFFESTRRLQKSLQVLNTQYPRAMVVIGRELSKLFEEIISMPISKALIWCAAHTTLRGEVTVAVALGELDLATEDTVDAPLAALKKAVATDFQMGASLKDLLGKYRAAGLSRTALYALLLEVKDQS